MTLKSLPHPKKKDGGVARGSGGGEGGRAEPRDCAGSRSVVCDTMTVDSGITHASAPTELQGMRLTVPCGPEMIKLTHTPRSIGC